MLNRAKKKKLSESSVLNYVLTFAVLTLAFAALSIVETTIPTEDYYREDNYKNFLASFKENIGFSFILVSWILCFLPKSKTFWQFAAQVVGWTACTAAWIFILPTPVGNGWAVLGVYILAFSFGIFMASLPRLVLELCQDTNTRLSFQLILIVLLGLSLFYNSNDIANIIESKNYVQDKEAFDKAYQNAHTAKDWSPVIMEKARKNPTAYPNVKFFTTFEEVKQGCSAVKAKSTAAAELKNKCIQKNALVLFQEQTSIEACVGHAKQIVDAGYYQLPTEKNPDSVMNYWLLDCLEKNGLRDKPIQETIATCQSLPEITLDQKTAKICMGQYGIFREINTPEECNEPFWRRNESSLCRFYTEAKHKIDPYQSLESNISAMIDSAFSASVPEEKKILACRAIEFYMRESLLLVWCTADQNYIKLRLVETMKKRKDSNFLTLLTLQAGMQDYIELKFSDDNKLQARD